MKIELSGVTTAWGKQAPLQHILLVSFLNVLCFRDDDAHDYLLYQNFNIDFKFTLIALSVLWHLSSF